MEFAELSLLILLAIAVASFLTAVVHGATGMAGGIILTAILSHMIGIKFAIPIMTCALIFSHSSRVLLYLSDLDWPSVKIVVLCSSPTIILGAGIFSYLPPAVIAAVMAIFLAVSFPIKAWARRKQLKTSDSVLAGASAGWGLLAGNVIGPGFVLAPFLLGRGMGRMTFVGSLATIVLCMNILKFAVFGVSTLLSFDAFLIGVVIGVITIPGNWLGKKVLLNMNDDAHRKIIDLMTLALIANFVYLALMD